MQTHRRCIIPVFLVMAIVTNQKKCANQGRAEESVMLIDWQRDVLDYRYYIQTVGRTK